MSVFYRPVKWVFAIMLYVFISNSITTSAFAFCFDEAGGKYGIPSALLKSIAKRESNLDPHAVNKNKNGSIDYGLMQINSFWFKKMGDDTAFTSDPCSNVQFGAWVLSDCIKRYGYNWDSLSCYRSGKPLSRLSHKTRTDVESYIMDIEKYFDDYSSAKDK